MADDRRKAENESLRAFVRWCEVEKFYGKTEITWQNGVAVSFNRSQTFKADEFVAPHAPVTTS